MVSVSKVMTISSVYPLGHGPVGLQVVSWSIVCNLMKLITDVSSYQTEQHILEALSNTIVSQVCIGFKIIFDVKKSLQESKLGILKDLQVYRIMIS